MFHKSLINAVERANATELIEIVPSALLSRDNAVDFFAKVPPAHMMEVKAERHVRSWLKDVGNLKG